MSNINDNELPPVIFLMGPTASGKTALGLKLAEVLPCDIISVDSVMVYRGMDIGTAKPKKEVLSRVPHRLVDIRDPAEGYNVFEFREDALSEMEKITKKGRIPLLLGGTMMYFKALCSGLAPLPAANEMVRRKINGLAQVAGWDYLHQKLLAVDPVAGERIKPTDTQRLLRALEVYEVTGQSLTHWHWQYAQDTLPYRIFNIILYPFDRAQLHNQIEKRFYDMLDQGFLGEVTKLYQRRDINLEMPALKSVGYRQLCSYLEGELIYNQAVRCSVIATRQFAKRQITWLRSWKEGVVFDAFSSCLEDNVLKMLAPLL